jgi:hypothetical protein
MARSPDPLAPAPADPIAEPTRGASATCPRSAGPEDSRRGRQPPKISRQILDRVADKWSLLVVAVLDHRTMRLSEFRGQIDGISRRMLM